MPIENSFIFFPSKYPEGDWDAQTRDEGGGQIRLSIEDREFTTSDGVKLHGWFCRPASVRVNEHEALQTPATLLWCHGNAGNITHRYDMIVLFMQMPLEVFIFDYRGYGRSEGKPSESGLYLDTRAAWTHLVCEGGLAAHRISILGKSIGAVPAIELATRVAPSSLIIDSAFTSLPDMAKAHMPFVPRFLLRTRMDSLGRIGQVACPKLFIHSQVDEIVPFELGRRLYEAAPMPKQFLQIEDAGHNDVHLAADGIYFRRIHEFVRSCVAPAVRE